MNTYWQIKGGNDKLLIFFNGWGCNEQVLIGVDVPGFDLVVLSDYSAPDCMDCELFNQVQSYGEVFLMAWSFGVFVAGLCFEHLPEIKCRVAINGTPWPIDHKRGIPPRIFKATLEGYRSEENRSRFVDRMMGGECILPEVKDIFYGRSTEDQRNELTALSELSDVVSLEPIKQDGIAEQWDVAVVSDADQIFPPRNMNNAWGDKAHVMHGNHFPDFQQIINQFILS